MADEYDDEPRRPKKRVQRAKDADSGNSTLKMLLIVFGSLAGVAVLSCCGGGVWLYYAGQKLVKNLDMKAPADIQKLTAEMTDITLPAEFVPQHGSSIFGIKKVDYQWCPGGNCVTRDDGLGMLTLTSIAIKDTQNPGQNISTFSAEQFSDASLKAQWKEFTKTEHEFDIRGKKCKFYIVQGEQYDFSTVDETEMDDEEESDDMTDTPVNPTGESTPAAPATTPAQPIAGRKAVHISGAFPGKQAEVTLELWLAPEQFDEAKILEMLKSIR